VRRLLSQARAAGLGAAAALALALAGCGSQTGRRASAGAPSATAATATAATATAATGTLATAGAAPHAHPQAVEPVAGRHGRAGAPAAPAVGDPTAHAPSLRTVRRELARLNLCGGTTSAADASPIVAATHAGFIADPGTDQTEGELPVITADLDALGRALGVTIYGISGYRSPAHSVAVGGYADDPHTRGEAEDIGVDSLLRASAARISEADLARYGLYRPFDPGDDPSNSEVNHVQLIPRGGPLTLAAATAAYDPDPSCR
jgi:hypothetical protein